MTSPNVSLNSGMRTFERLVSLGLRPGHLVLDVGCGPLLTGRHLISYLGRTAYFGIEPHKPLVDLGVQDLPPGLIAEREPQFCSTSNPFMFAGIFVASFDYILMSSIWTHASHVQIRELLRSAARAGTGKVIVLADYYTGIGVDEGGTGAEDYLDDYWAGPDTVCHNRKCIETASEGLWEYHDLDRDPNQWCVLTRK